MIITEIFNKVLDRNDLTSEEVIFFIEEIISGNCTDVEIAGWLVALRMKGETASEIAACIEIMRNVMLTINCSDEKVIDIVGTGGDGVGTYNISTAAALVAAGAGITVAKHGNRALSSQSGSADIFSELGVRLDLTLEQSTKCLSLVGISFLFAPLFHPSMKNVLTSRRELKIRTIFNLLGPMTNPAMVVRGVIGVYNEHYCRLLAEASIKLGVKHMLFVHGDGLDEFSVSGLNTVYEVQDDNIEKYTLSAEEVGLKSWPIEELLGGSARVNKQALVAVMKGEKNAYRDSVIFNAGAGIYTAGKVDSIKEGCDIARETIDLGKAWKKIIELQDFMQKCD